MAVTAAELNVVFASDTSDLKKGAGEAQGILKNVAATAGGFLAAQAFTGMVGGLKDLAAGMISANAQAETMRMNLDIAAGSMERGGTIFADLQKMAANTPFEFPELMQSAVALESLGVNAMDYIDLLGNTAAATGKSLDQVTQAFLDAQMGEFERLKEFGIRAAVDGENVLFTYMTAHGQVTKEVEKGNQAMYQSTLEAIWSEKYAGAMDTLSQSFAGRWSTLKDNFNLLMQEMGKPLFAFVGNGIAALNSFFGIFNKLREKGVTTFQAMWSGIRRSLKEMLGADNPLFGFIKDVKREIVRIVDAWREGGIVGVVQQVWDDAGKAFEKAWYGLIGWLGSTGIPNLITAVDTVRQKLAANAPGWIEGALAGLQRAWAGIVKWVTRDGVPAVLGAIAAFRENVGPKITEGISALIDALIANWPRVLNWLANDGVPSLVVKGAELVGAIVKGITDHWGDITAWIRDNGWKALVGALAYPAALVTAAGAIVIGILNGLREVWATQLYPWVRDTLGWKGWQAFFQGAATWLLQPGRDVVAGIETGVIERWTTFRETVDEKVTGFKAAFADAKTWLLQAGRDIVQGLWDGVTEQWNAFTADLLGKFDALPDWARAGLDKIGLSGMSGGGSAPAATAPHELRFSGGGQPSAQWLMAGGSRGGTYDQRTINLTVHTQATDPDGVATAVLGRLYGAMDRVGAGVA